MRVAALTMSYNEPVWAPVWARHYARQVGAENCFLMDHGSDDGSTDGLNINVERLERSALDEDDRAARVSARAAALLEHYDAVVHADIDELVLADPRRYHDLRSYSVDCGEAVITAVGLDIQHLEREEAALDISRPLGEQRRWTRFSAAMCKPVFVRRAVRWTPGFHSCDAPLRTGGLFLLHLRYSDLSFGLRRLQRTRTQAFASLETNPHQRVADAEFAAMIDAIGHLPKVTVPFDTESGVIADWVKKVSAAREHDERWLSIAGDELWAIPRRVAALI